MKIQPETEMSRSPQSERDRPSQARFEFTSSNTMEYKVVYWPGSSALSQRRDYLVWSVALLSHCL